MVFPSRNRAYVRIGVVRISHDARPYAIYGSIGIFPAVEILLHVFRIVVFSRTYQTAVIDVIVPLRFEGLKERCGASHNDATVGARYQVREYAFRRAVDIGVVEKGSGVAFWNRNSATNTFTWNDTFCVFGEET